MSVMPITVCNSKFPTQKRVHVCGTVIRGPCYFCDLLGHFVEYISNKMIESSQRTLSWLHYANMDIKIAI